MQQLTVSTFRAYNAIWISQWFENQPTLVTSHPSTAFNTPNALAATSDFTLITKSRTARVVARM
jgi:hypothetical protein